MIQVDPNGNRLDVFETEAGVCVRVTRPNGEFKETLLDADGAERLAQSIERALTARRLALATGETPAFSERVDGIGYRTGTAQ